MEPATFVTGVAWVFGFLALTAFIAVLISGGRNLRYFLWLWLRVALGVLALAVIFAVLITLVAIFNAMYALNMWPWDPGFWDGFAKGPDGQS